MIICIVIYVCIVIVSGSMSRESSSMNLIYSESGFEDDAFEQPDPKDNASSSTTPPLTKAFNSFTKPGEAKLAVLKEGKDEDEPSRESMSPGGMRVCCSD